MHRDDQQTRLKALSAEERRELLEKLLREKRTRHRILPTSFAQRRLWFLDQMGAGSAYNVPRAYLLVGQLDAGVLEEAVNAIVRRHEVLRTTFAGEGGVPRQVVAPSLHVPLPVTDLRDLDPETREVEVARAIDADRTGPFDLARGPLLRTALLRLGDDEHMLLVNMHHIVTDGSSQGLFRRELFEHYRAIRAGEPPDVPALPIQYGDFAAWQEEWVRSGELERQRSYWIRRLGHDLPVLDLPTDRPRPAMQTFNGAAHGFQLPSALGAALRELCRAQAVTPAMLFLAAFQLLLSKHTGQLDIVVGSPIANRNRPEIEHLIGFFVNTLVQRTDLTGDPTFVELLERVKRVSLEGYEHQDLPFEHLVDELQPDRDLAQNPIFQVLFVMQNAPRVAMALGDLDVQQVPQNVSTTRFDLELFVWDAPNGFGGTFTYNTDLFDASTIARFAGHLETLLEGIVARPEARVSELALLSDAERARVLVEWNDTAADVDANRCLHELFGEQARRTPDAVALVSEGTRVTFEELDRRSNRLAHHLRALGVRSEVPVALCMPRMPELVTAILGILKAGGAYVPLDPAYPAPRLQQIVEDAGATIIVTHGSLADALPSSAARVVRLDADGPAIDREPETPVPPCAAPGNLAYVIYTSGSTGRSKGVAIAHASAASLIGWAAGVFDADARRGMLASTSVCFDLSVFELFLPLCRGGTVLLAENALALPELPARNDVTLVNTVPSAIAELLRQETLPPSVRTVCLAGEPLSAELADRLYAAGVERVFDLYGPSEDTTYSTCALRERGGPATIGRPIANGRAYVLDAALEPVPIGVPGELYLGGAGLARGYLDQAALTAERFVPDPFGREPGARLYRTGDLARYRLDGTLVFLGRNDHQVKIRGYRIELGEIESALRGHSAVRETVVTARSDDAEEQRLVAYVVSAQDRSAEREGAQVGQWRTLWEQTYERSSAGDPTFDITGWNSSYTGEPIPAEEMRDWVERTVERLRERQPRRVLEIGCGSGLLLYRVAPHCERYHATDFSQRALDAIARHRAEHVPANTELILERRHADDFEGLEPASFDAVVLNSVIQYFPGVEYLLRVLEGAVDLVAPGGTVFVGDVRNLLLLEAYHVSVQRHRAAADLPVDQLRRLVRQQLGQEEELVVDPALFLALRRHLPRIGRVEIQPKRGSANDELTKFRYDVTLHVGDPVPPAPAETWSDWSDERPSIESIRYRLLEESPERLGFRRVPNARTEVDGAAVRLLEDDDAGETVRSLRDAATRAAQGVGIAPDHLWALAEQTPYRVALSWAATDVAGAYDVLFERRDAPEALAFPASELRSRPWSTYANRPMQARLSRELVLELREHLAAGLPEYMVPASFVALDALPLTANGKIDRKKLPAPEWERPRWAGAYVAPSTAIEKRMAEIWQTVLRVERVGANDNFFELGGHSLMATQVISRVRDAFGVELPVPEIFARPTVAMLAETIAARSTGADDTLPLVPVDRDGALPLSFAQQRLWLLDGLEPGNPAYNIALAWRLRGPLDAAALARSLNAIVDRHEVLRTTLPDERGEPRQVIAPALRLELRVEDFGARAEAEIRAEARAEARRPFDLARGPLVRARLLRAGDDDHVLLLTMHHVVTDGWSMQVLCRELSALYGAFHAGEASPLPELPTQYADYADWQRRWLESEAPERELRYWKTKLADAPPPLDLPTDRPRPAVQTHRGASEQWSVPSRTLVALRELARAENASLFMTLVAALGAQLMRYTGEEDILVGMPISGRNHREVEDLIGCFLNTLVLRLDVSGGPTCRALLQRVRSATLEAYEHQSVPFEKLIEELQPERDLSRNPLFQVFCNMVDLSGVTIDLGPIGVTPFGDSGEHAKFDLTLYFFEQADRVTVKLNYNTDLFDAATVRAMLEQFGSMLEAFAADPEQPVSAVRLRTHGDAKLLPDPTAVLTETDQVSIPALIDAWAARTPEQPAIARGARCWSYGELAASAATIAHDLHRRGVKRGDVVAIRGAASYGAIAAMLGTMRSGGVLLTLDPSLPAARQQIMLREAVVTHLIELGAKAPGDRDLPRAAHVIDVDPETGRLDPVAHPNGAADGRDPDFGPGPNDLAYVFFTSGSTGVPKGVLGVNKALGHFLSWQRDAFAVGPGDRCAQVTAMSFDVVLRDVLLPLVSGATLCLPKERDRMPDRLLAWLARDRVTLVHAVPALADAWLAECAPETRLPDLRCTFFAGEPLTDTLVGRWRELLADDARIVNLYGPTETTLAKCWYEVPDPPIPGVQPIGQALPQAQALVLNAAGAPCGVGEPGEIVLRTPYRSRGYINASAEDARRFIPNPFRHHQNDVLYRSGDRGRYAADGTLRILGRLDHQVKIRGVRVEPDEVAATLVRHPAVGACVVTAVSDPEGVRRLVGYVVPSAEAPDSERLSAFLRERLPIALVPSCFVLLDELPRNPNGKVDRRALPAPDLRRPERAAEFVAPRNEIEIAVACVWHDVLGVDGIGIHDNFFTLGGHSLSAMQAAARVRERLGVELPVRAFFEVPTVAGLAERIDALRWALRGGTDDRADSDWEEVGL